MTTDQKALALEAKQYAEEVLERTKGFEILTPSAVIAQALLDSLEREERAEELLRECEKALAFVVKHEETTVDFDPEVHKFNRYRENMYWEAKNTLAKLRAEKDSP